MNCSDLDRWLDQGAPGALETAARAHAASCPRCAAEIARMNELDLALASFTAPAPPDFTPRVMRRVADAPRHTVTWAPPPAVSWWVRAAADPAAALALLLAGLILLGDGSLTRMVTWLAQGAIANTQNLLAAVPGALAALPGAHAARFPSLPSMLGAPGVALALWLAGLPALLWASWRLFGWMERAFSPRFQAPRTATTPRH